MIHVDRARIPRPGALSMDIGSPANSEFAKAAEFYNNPKTSHQQRFVFSVYKLPEVRKALEELFHGKCAYCESRVLKTAPLDVEMFRPKSGVVESPQHPGYWWLAMEWNNLLPSCIDCNRIRSHEGIKSGKGNRFPLEDESKRAFHVGQESREKPMLLDPCSPHDNPEEHFVFEENGVVVSDTPRGQTTIAVYGLNRLGLVAARRYAAAQVRIQLDLFIASSATPKSVKGALFETQLQSIKALTRPDEEFAALKRQLVRSSLETLTDSTGSLVLVPIEESTPHISKARKRRAKTEFSSFEQDQSNYSLTDKEGFDKYRLQRRFIERIELRNIKAIKSLDLDLTSKGSPTSWFMLLGENATGKSTILQATAMTLIGLDPFVRLAQEHNIHPKDFLRYRCKNGTISIKLSGFSKPHTLTIRENQVDFKGPTGTAKVSFSGKKIRPVGNGWHAQTCVLGYGATRLLPRDDAKPYTPSQKEFSRVDNLFNPFVPLLDARRWMLQNSKHFDKIALILKDLLALDPSIRLGTHKGQVVVIENRNGTPLRRLSDGYQSMVAMTVDILEVAFRLWPNLEDAEGTILIDELGAHLHPTWKMKVVGALRKALPSMQFLVTTHDPLCLRGLGEREVAVMRRDEAAKVEAITDLPSPADFRVDQLLTSDFFGLNSTVDPDTEAIFDEYYALMALRDPSPDQLARLNTLRDQLKTRRYLGTTLREHLMYNAIDQLIVDHRREPIPIAELQRYAVDEVAQIWNQP